MVVRSIRRASRIPNCAPSRRERLRRSPRASRARICCAPSTSWPGPKQDVRFAQPRYHLEMALLRWIHLGKLAPIAEVIEALDAAGRAVEAPRAAPPLASPRLTPLAGRRRAPTVESDRSAAPSNSQRLAPPAVAAEDRAGGERHPREPAAAPAGRCQPIRRRSRTAFLAEVQQGEEVLLRHGDRAGAAHRRRGATACVDRVRAAAQGAADAARSERACARGDRVERMAGRGIESGHRQQSVRARRRRRTQPPATSGASGAVDRQGARSRSRRSRAKRAGHARRVPAGDQGRGRTVK